MYKIKRKDGDFMSKYEVTKVSNRTNKVLGTESFNSYAKARQFALSSPDCEKRIMREKPNAFNFGLGRSINVR